jgi:hypothetical protein
MDCRPRLSVLKLRNFRSYIDSGDIRLSRINVFIGENNAGKSNIIKAIERGKPNFKGGIRQGKVLKLAKVEFRSTDKTTGVSGETPTELAFTFNFNYTIKDFLDARSGSSPIIGVQKPGGIDEDTLNRPFTFTPIFQLNDLGVSNVHIGQVIATVQNEIQRVLKAYDTMVNVDTIVNYFSTAILNQIESQIIIIPDMRKPTHGTSYSGGGEGITAWIKMMNHPESDKINYWDSVERAVFSFIRKVLSLPDNINIKIRVDSSGEKVLFKIGEAQERCIDDFGSGIRELIILAVDFSHLSNAIISIEEPEIHLHPVLIKALFDFFIENSKINNNQYIITTHSHIPLARILRDPGTKEAIIYNVELINGYTHVARIPSEQDLYDVLLNIGNEPSDLLLANCVIWVEGPSDRVYINKWLDLFCRDKNVTRPIEKYDYTFAYYSGACLKHYSFETDEEKAADFGRLLNFLPLSRRPFVIMDSDLLEKVEGELVGDLGKQHKLRVIEECKGLGKEYWITEGREIENYLDLSVIQQVYKQIKKYGLYDKLGLIEEDKPGFVKGSSTYSKDKPGGAEKITGYLNEENAFNKEHLKHNIEALLNFINAAESR